MSYILEKSVCNVIFFLFLFLLQLNVSSEFVSSFPDLLRRFEYKLSFKGPHLVFKDGTVPFWEHSGSNKGIFKLFFVLFLLFFLYKGAIASNDQIRITPSLRS